MYFVDSICSPLLTPSQSRLQTAPLCPFFLGKHVLSHNQSSGNTLQSILFLHVSPHVAESCSGAVFHLGGCQFFLAFLSLKETTPKLFLTPKSSSVVQHICLDFFSMPDSAVPKERASIRTLGSESFSLGNGSGDRVVQAHIST